MTDLVTTVRGGVRAAFKAIDSLCKTVQYFELTGGMVRDLEAGTVTPASNQYSLEQVLLTRFKSKDVDKYPDINLKNMKALFPAENLSVWPKTDDYFIVPSGKYAGKWIVQQNLGEPSETLGILEVRQS